MSRIFITGGSGFIGTNLIQALLLAGHTVLNFDLRPPRNLEHHSVFSAGDLLDFEKLAKQVESFAPEYLVHLAARTDLEGKNLAEYSANTQGVQNVIEATLSSKTLKRVLFASSRLVCKIGYSPVSDRDYCPTTFYGESKVVGEKLVRENASRLPYAWNIFRPTSIWGPWFGTPYKEFFFSVLRSQYVHPLGQKIYKSFGYVGNAVYLVEKMLACEPEQIHQKTIYLADYEPIEVSEWARLIAMKSKLRPPREVPVWILRSLGLAGDLLKLAGWKNPPLTSFRVKNLLANMVYDTSQLEKLGGALPFSVETGIDLTLKWIETQRVNSGKM